MWRKFKIALKWRFKNTSAQQCTAVNYVKRWKHKFNTLQEKLSYKWRLERVWMSGRSEAVSAGVRSRVIITSSVSVWTWNNLQKFNIKESDWSTWWEREIASVGGSGQSAYLCHEDPLLGLGLNMARLAWRETHKQWPNETRILLQLERFTHWVMLEYESTLGCSQWSNHVINLASWKGNK